MAKAIRGLAKSKSAEILTTLLLRESFFKKRNIMAMARGKSIRKISRYI
jgi:hypothetical protein